MSISSSLTSEIQKLAPSAVIELYELDLTALGGDLFRFHAGTNELKGNIVWNGNSYVRFPVQVTGFEITGQGQFPRPKMSVSNFLSVITTINLQYGDLQGAKVTRRRTMVKFLDAVNFESGVNANADPTAEFEADVYFVDRKSSENRNSVEYELASSCDLNGIQVPRRQIIQNICPWIYRGEGCGYAGSIVADENDVPLDRSLLTSPEAKAYFTAGDVLTAKSAALNIAQANLNAAGNAMDAACSARLLESKYVAPTVDGSGNVVTNGSSVNYIRSTGEFVFAFWNDVQVSIGSTYRVGSLVGPMDFHYPALTYSCYTYAIERWGFDSTDCTNKTTAYNSAKTALQTAQSDYDAALADVDTAFAAIPPTDPFFTLDRCGKRLSSCRLRFGEGNEIPFGAFPAVGLTK